MLALKAKETFTVSSVHHTMANMLGTYLFWTIKQRPIDIV